MKSSKALTTTGQGFSFASCLDALDRVVIVQNGEDVPAASIAMRAGVLADAIKVNKWSRVALTIRQASAMVAALAAGQKALCDVLLIRDRVTNDKAIWESWRVSALLDENFAVSRTFDVEPVADLGAILLTTSGTTGTPKVARHDLDRLISRVLQARVQDDQARWLLTYHPASFAGLQVVLTTLATGGTLIALTQPSIPDLAETALRHFPTHISGTPTFWRAFLLTIAGAASRLPLRQITLGGEAVDQSTLDQLHEAFPNARMTHIYASTEAGALFAVRDGRAGFPVTWLDQGIEGSRLRIRNQVLEISSPRAMHGYLGGAPRKNLTEDGWLISGDVVEVMGDRVLFRGRIDDVINVGGTKVMPEEIEAVLLRYDAVQELRVYGRCNPLVGAVVCADVVLAHRIDEEDARRALYAFASEHLEMHKRPRIFNFVPSIATASGKKSRSIQT